MFTQVRNKILQVTKGLNMETTMTKEERIFVSTPVDSDLLEKLDEMAAAKESSRAQLIRLFIREKYEEFQRDEKHKKNLLKAVTK